MITLHALQAIMQSPYIHGALTGLLAAAATDLHAFRSWQSFHDAASYNWDVAAWRWLQGAVLGTAGAAGLGMIGL